ncbi:DNA-binding protein [Escherichia coli]|nr:DNA-binding protein [Escherichia coli]
MTAEQVKALFRQEVYRVLNGQTKARYGKSHEIAVKLGLKSTAQAA